jgi:hypothetical protein
VGSDHPTRRKRFHPKQPTPLICIVEERLCTADGNQLDEVGGGARVDFPAADFALRCFIILASFC